MSTPFESTNTTLPTWIALEPNRSAKVSNVSVASVPPPETPATGPVSRLYTKVTEPFALTMPPEKRSSGRKPPLATDVSFRSVGS